jgi:hypothetical protein
VGSENDVWQRKANEVEMAWVALRRWGVMTRLEANDGEARRCRTDDSEKSLSVARARWERRCGGGDNSEVSEEQEMMCKVSVARAR